MLLWVVGGSNVHDGPHAIRDCRFLSPDVRSGEIRRERHRQGATLEITRRHSFGHKREREIPLNGCAFWRSQRSRLKGGDYGCGVSARFDRCFSCRLSVLRGDQPGAVLISTRGT